MKKSDMWITLLASIGVGAAAYYTMSKSDKPMSKAVESVAPMLSGITNSNNNTNSSSNTNNNTEQLGPHGMS